MDFSMQELRIFHRIGGRSRGPERDHSSRDLPRMQRLRGSPLGDRPRSLRSGPWEDAPTSADFSTNWPAKKEQSAFLIISSPGPV